MPHTRPKLDSSARPADPPGRVARNTTPDRYAVVGFPIGHSYSPLIHRLFAEQTGENLTYTRLAAKPEEFNRAVRQFAADGGRGLNVTVPHKEAAFELANEIGPEAERAGAVNTLSFTDNGRIRGDNTDGIGFRRDIERNHELALRGKRTLVLGAGGAARGVLAALLDARPGELVLANRTVQRATDLLATLGAPANFSASTLSALSGREPFDVVVNATSLGLHAAKLPFPPNCLSEETFAYDLVYGPQNTPFVDWAVRHGAGKAVQGWGMLVEQAGESFALWRGVRPETSPVLETVLAQARG